MKNYRKKGIQPMRPYQVGEDLSKVNVGPGVLPTEGGMIAHNPSDTKDQWYISKAYFDFNYIEA